MTAQCFDDISPNAFLGRHYGQYFLPVAAICLVLAKAVRLWPYHLRLALLVGCHNFESVLGRGRSSAVFVLIAFAEQHGQHNDEHDRK